MRFKGCISHMAGNTDICSNLIFMQLTRFLRFGILGLTCWFLSTQQLAAQMAGNRSMNLSDQQLIQLWKQAQQKGLSENDAMKLLVQKGLPASEVNTFKRRLVDLQSGNQKGKFSADELIADTSTFFRDSSWVKEVPLLKKRSPYFGFDFFNRPNISFEPAFNTGTPKNYVLGPGDEVMIAINGLNETFQRAIVSREGKLALPHTAPIAVTGLTIDQAITQAKKKLAVVYPAINSGQTTVDITLGNVKSIRVTVIGEAENPGAYVVSGLSSFFNVLYLSGGPSSNGSLRSIEIIRNNKVLQTVDFYQFLLKGIMPSNIRLEDQDIIRYPVYRKRVALGGEVKKPATYELLEKETLAELMQYAGGTTELAITPVAKVVQTTEQEKSLREVSEKDFAYFIPRQADSVYFERINSPFRNRVQINGAVLRPGDYAFENGLTLQQLIKKAGGLRDEAFVNRGYIKRRKAAETETALLHFQPAGLNAQDILLQKEDSVVILQKDMLRDNATITIAGSVRNPVTITYRPGMTIEDAIILAGGFQIDAAFHKVEVSRIQKNSADTLANQLTTVVQVNVDSTLQPTASSMQLQPLDYIFVPKLLNYRILGNVKIRGEVLYAGDYVLEKRNETIQELIQRAGGLSPFASMQDVQVFRNNLRVGTELLSDASQQRFLLQPGDSIFIPRNEPFVEVKGAVFTPQILSYDGAGFLQYISAAGGVTDRGNLKRAYIQYSNGINRKTRHFLFFRNYPTVKPGSKIIIPERPADAKKGLSIIEITALTGGLSALVSLISVLRN